MLTNKGKLNLQKGDRYWTDLSIKGTWKKQSPKLIYSKKVKVNPKTIHRSDLYKVRPYTRQQTEDAHVEHLKKQRRKFVHDPNKETVASTIERVVGAET